MFSRAAIAIVIIYVVWSVLDFLVHGVLLMPQYEATAELWLPQEEMRMGLMFMVRLVLAAAFVLIYLTLVSPKHLGRGLLYGMLYGIASGTGMGYGTYSYMDIPYEMAFLWFVNAVIQLLIAGFVVGALVKEPAPKVS